MPGYGMISLIAAVVAAVVALTPLSIPTEADLQEMGAILCGESCGFPYQARLLVADNLKADWYRLGTEGLKKRWYAYRPNTASTEMMRLVFTSPSAYPRCRFIGGKWDAIHWKQMGYLALDAKPDYTWSVQGGRYQLHAYGCAGFPAQAPQPGSTSKRERKHEPL